MGKADIEKMEPPAKPRARSAAKRIADKAVSGGAALSGDESGGAEAGGAHGRILKSSTRPKTHLRTQQRKHTRAKIVSAAIVEFEAKRFHYATVDDIASRANISRATFYTHFRGKEEVLLDIIIQLHSTKHLTFVPLVEAPVIDEAFLVGWLKNTVLARFANDRGWLFSYYVVCDLYADMANFFSDGRDEIVDFLGLRFGAFRAVGPAGKTDAGKRARGHLELYKIEQFALHAVYPGLSVPLDAFAAEVAKGLFAFLQSDTIGPPVPQAARCHTTD